jgi:hypothetical protein
VGRGRFYGWFACGVSGGVGEIVGRFQISDFRFQNSDFRFQMSDVSGTGSRE